MEMASVLLENLLKKQMTGIEPASSAWEADVMARMVYLASSWVTVPYFIRGFVYSGFWLFIGSGVKMVSGRGSVAASFSVWIAFLLVGMMV